MITWTPEEIEASLAVDRKHHEAASVGEWLFDPSHNAAGFLKHKDTGLSFIETSRMDVRYEAGKQKKLWTLDEALDHIQKFMPGIASLSLHRGRFTGDRDKKIMSWSWALKIVYKVKGLLCEVDWSEGGTARETAIRGMLKLYDPEWISAVKSRIETEVAGKSEIFPSGVEDRSLAGEGDPESSGNEAPVASESAPVQGESEVVPDHSSLPHPVTSPESQDKTEP